MAQIPIISGINTSISANFIPSSPRNLVPVIQESGISEAYLKLADGISQFGLFNASIIGADRGAINWLGNCYRVIGQYFVRVESDGTITILATVPVGGYVRFDYSFDYLAIAISGGLYLWNGATLVQNVDPDLLTVVDMLWIDGYFMTTDGEFLVVTDLTNPFAVNPLKYGSAESDPDPVLGLLKIRSEVYAMNRNTIEVFDNVGGSGFPFQRVQGAIVQKGAIGTRTSAVYRGTIAFMGSARNEQPSVYMIQGGQAFEIATREITDLLKNYTEAQLAACLMEVRSHDTLDQLYIHLPDQTIVYDDASSQLAKQPIWFFLSSGNDGYGIYRAINFVWAYDKWLCGDLIDARVIGRIDGLIGDQYGNSVGYQFDTPISYTEGTGAIVNSIELVCLTGRPQYGVVDFVDQSIRHSYSYDGLVWSNPKQKSLGKAGDTTKRVTWTSRGLIRNWRVDRFQGRTKVPVAFARLEAEYETLNN